VTTWDAGEARLAHNGKAARAGGVISVGHEEQCSLKTTRHQKDYIDRYFDPCGRRELISSKQFDPPKQTKNP
jgi:hypothetical protein